MADSANFILVDLRNRLDAEREMERHRQWIAEYDERKRREADG